jgi:hypothetical protein
VLVVAKEITAAKRIAVQAEREAEGREKYYPENVRPILKLCYASGRN